MGSFRGTWFVIGGWAVDAWLGRQSRRHRDVDIGVFRDDERAIFDYLAGWHLVGHDTPDADHDDEWDGSPLRFPAHIHARHPDWPELDLNFNERSGDTWFVNREPLLTVSIDAAIRVTDWDVPTLGPELVLWHKGRGEIRPHDEADFQALLPYLDDRERRWLARSLALLDAGHPWLVRLEAIVTQR